MIVAGIPRPRDCLEQVPSRIRPSRRERSDPYPRLINRPDRSTPIRPNHTVPYGTVPVFARIPGNKLPGYYHSVPPGQRHSAPIRPIAVSPIRRFASLRDGSLFCTDTRQSRGPGMPGYHHSVPPGRAQKRSNTEIRPAGNGMIGSATPELATNVGRAKNSARPSRG
jgi:hypothetical protein